MLVAATTALPAGQYCAISFVGGGGAITTAFPQEQVPLLSAASQLGITFPDGYTLYTPLVIPAASVGRINCPVVLYKPVL